jgi:hypothetical protein
MAKTKKQCPECSTHTISFLKKNIDVIYDEQNRFKKLGKAKSVEQTVNLMIQEWKTDRDVENAIKNNHGK